MSPQPRTYADSGVDIDAGEQVVALIKRDLRRTYGPRVLNRHGGFAGCFRLDYNEDIFQRNYRDPVLVSCTDGVGSKVKLACQMGVLDTVGQDCVAMSVNDLIVQGAEPLFMLDYVGVHKLHPATVASIVRGVADGCKLAGCALLGGETAELPDLYAPGEFDLVGFATGVCELRRIIDGSRADDGDVVLGLASSGVHSNGYSLVRAIVKEAKLDLDRIYPELDELRTLGQVLMTPTRIYARPIVDVLHNYAVKRPVSAMCHVTGGGLVGNLPRVLPSHLDAKVNAGAWRIPRVFEFLRKRGRVETDEMFRVFNMGIGYVCVVRPWFADSIAHQLTRAGEQVYALGKLVKGVGRVVIG